MHHPEHYSRLQNVYIKVCTIQNTTVDYKIYTQKNAPPRTIQSVTKCIHESVHHPEHYSRLQNVYIKVCTIQNTTVGYKIYMRVCTTQNSTIGYSNCIFATFVHLFFSQEPPRLGSDFRNDLFVLCIYWMSGQ